MKTSATILTFFLGTFAFPVTAAEPATGMPAPVEAEVYLLAGQSNMEGVGKLGELPEEAKNVSGKVFFWTGTAFEPLVPGKTRTAPPGRFGPEIGFAAGLAAAHPATPVYLIKFAIGGQPLHYGWRNSTQWVGAPPAPKRATFYPGESPDNPNAGLHYLAMRACFTKALAALDAQKVAYKVRGIVWMQGEADAKHETAAKDYARMLRLLKTRLEQDLKTPNLPLVYGQVLPYAPALARFVARDMVRAQQMAADHRSGKPEAIPGAWMVPTDGYKLNPDRVHYNADSQWRLGDSFAKTMLTAQTSMAADSKPSPDPAAATADSGVTVKDGVIHCFTEGIRDGVITHARVEGRAVWVDAIKRDGKIRQLRVTSTERGGKTPINLYCPEPADGSFSWNMKVKREGDVVSATLPWNAMLIGDFMDVNEGGDDAEAVRKKLGVAPGADSKLPVLYSSGDSISRGYWPYLEAELNTDANVYYQIEVAKDIPEFKIKLTNNGHAHLAYACLQTAYENPRFKPKYILMNFGLHMLAGYGGKPAEYGKWIEKMDDLAKEHDARLIWVMTTPYEETFRPGPNKTILKFNQTAKAVAAKRKIPTVDLHACVLAAVKELGPKKVYTDGTHYTDAAKQHQAAFIAARIREIMKNGSSSK